MGEPRTRVDHERLAGGAGAFADFAERCAGIDRDLRQVLDEVGECWGSDAVGRSFASTHVAAADRVLTRLGELPDELETVGAKLARSAATYRQTEQDNADAVRAARPPSSD